MYNYQVHVLLKGRSIRPIITAQNSCEARRIAEAQYPEAVQICVMGRVN